MRYKDLRGERFGSVLVQEYVGSTERNQARWQCLCDCGKIFVTQGNYLLAGDTRSCGCSRVTHPGNLQHGHTSKNGKRIISKAYSTWARMKQRCDDIHDKGYVYYGGRGITYDPLWKDFAAFLADMGEPPSGMTLDRRDNNGAYSKVNCRWVSRKTQNRNSRHNVLITYGDKSQPLSVWSEERNIKYQRLYDRIHKLQWPVGKALEFER